MLSAAQNTGTHTSTLSDSDGKIIARIQIMGETVLTNGKDISGNLGSKTTYGDKSPIIENVSDSTLNFGDGNIVNQNHQTIIDKLSDLKKEVITNANLTSGQKNQAIGDIETIRSQLGKETPNKNIIKEAWTGLKGFLGDIKTIIEIGKCLAYS